MLDRGGSCQSIQDHKDMEMAANIHFLECLYGSMCYPTENTKPYYTWERKHLLEFTMAIPLGWVSYFVLLKEKVLLKLN